MGHLHAHTDTRVIIPQKRITQKRVYIKCILKVGGEKGALKESKAKREETAIWLMDDDYLWFLLAFKQWKSICTSYEWQHFTLKQYAAEKSQ